jgi:hypothetical protein
MALLRFFCAFCDFFAAIISVPNDQGRNREMAAKMLKSRKE